MLRAALIGDFSDDNARRRIDQQQAIVDHHVAVGAHGRHRGDDGLRHRLCVEVEQCQGGLATPVANMPACPGDDIRRGMAVQFRKVCLGDDLDLGPNTQQALAVPCTAISVQYQGGKIVTQMDAARVGTVGDLVDVVSKNGTLR